MKDKIKQREMCAWELQGVRCSEAGPGSTFNEIIAEMCPSWKSREAADLVKLSSLQDTFTHSEEKSNDCRPTPGR